jgi:hypothetical protein
MSLLALTALYPPVVTHIWMGQAKFIVLLLLVLTMRWMERQRDGLAGFALALASLLRVFPLALGGYLLLQQRRRVFICTALIILVGSGLTVARVGFDTFTCFIPAASLLLNGPASENGRNISVHMFIFRQLQAALPYSNEFAASVARVLNIVAELLILLTTARATLTQPVGNDPDSRIYSLWVATSIVLIPIVWDYDLTLMLIPFGVLVVVAARGEASRRAIAMAVVSYVLMIFWDYLTPTRFECGFLSMMTAYLCAYWLAVDQPSAVRLPIHSIPAELWHRLVFAG